MMKSQATDVCYGFSTKMKRFGPCGSRSHRFPLEGSLQPVLVEQGWDHGMELQSQGQPQFCRQHRERQEQGARDEGFEVCGTSTDSPTAPWP